MKKNNIKIKPCILGLGYVGLPIFIKLSKSFKTCGFDISKKRIKELKKKKDTNYEFKRKDLELKNKSYFTYNKQSIVNSNFYIITVPTPVNKKNEPDLSLINVALQNLGMALRKGNIIILESTVYPGLTENYCINVLKKYTKLTVNKDFFIGYSPERINPGDKKHTLEKISKIVAFKNEKNLRVVKDVYKNLGKKLIYTKSIKEAETAKVVENIQRDLNIAFMNEIYIFCKKNRLNFNEVMRLASSKWNFLPFKPGLVGGHCLPVDPYYFSHIAKKKGQTTKVTLAGRKTNNSMTHFLANMIIKNIRMNKNYKKFKYLIAGLTYKPNVSDLRNSLAIKVCILVKKKINNLETFDPYITVNKKINLKKKFIPNRYQKIFILTNHDMFKKFYNDKNNKFYFAFKNL